MASASQILAEIRHLKNPESVKGMAAYGINPKNSYGVCMPRLQAIAKRAGRDHPLALKLWASGIRDARLIAAIIADPALATPKQMDAWAKGLNSWDVCDGACMNYFCRTKFAYRKVAEWSRSREEFVRRAGFATLAFLAVHDKKAEDKVFEKWLPVIVRASTDERNYVKKAVNWALRQIGKRNLRLNKLAAATAARLAKSASKSARWIGSDALRELKNPKTIQRLRQKANFRRKKTL